MITPDTYINGNLNVDNKLLVSRGIVATALPITGNLGEIDSNAKTRSMTMTVNGERNTYITVNNYGIIMYHDGDRFGTAIIHDEHIVDTSYLYSNDDRSAEYICTLSFDGNFHVRLYSTDGTLLRTTTLSHTDLPQSYSITDIWDRTSTIQYEAITDRCWFYVIKSNTEFVRLSIAYIKKDDNLSVTLNINNKNQKSCVFNTSKILTDSTIKRFINSSTVILETKTTSVPAYASANNGGGTWYLDYTAINTLSGIKADKWKYITQVTHPTLSVIWSFISITMNDQSSIWVGLRVNSGSSAAFSVDDDIQNRIQQSDRFMIYSSTHTDTGSVICVITENALYTMELTYNGDNSYQSNIRIDCNNLNEYGNIIFYTNNSDVLEICTQVASGEYRWNVFNKNTRTITVSNITLDNVSTILRTHGSILWTTNGPAIIDRAVVNATVPMIGMTITDLYKRIAYLENRIIELEKCMRRENDYVVVNGRKIGSGSGDIYSEKFTNDYLKIIPDIRCNTQTTENIEEISAVMEIGNVIDFHVPNSDFTSEGGRNHMNCPGKKISDDKTDYCARIYIDRNNTMIIRANGLYFEPIDSPDAGKRPFQVVKPSDSAVVKTILDNNYVNNVIKGGN